MIQSFYESVLEEIDETAKRINLDPGIHKMIRLPEWELLVSLPIVSDYGVEGSEDRMYLVSNFVDQLDLDLDKERLKVMIKEMYIEAQDSNIKW